jgi:hypothetical protein
LVSPMRNYTPCARIHGLWEVNGMQMCMVDTIVTCLLMHMALGAHLFLHNDKLHTLCPSQASPAARATSNGSQRAFEHVRVSCGCGARVKSHDPMMQSHGIGPKGRVWVRTFKCYLLQPLLDRACQSKSVKSKQSERAHRTDCRHNTHAQVRKPLPQHSTHRTHDGMHLSLVPQSGTTIYPLRD